MFLLASGQVKVCKEQPGRKPVQLALLAPGAFFGEMCILETLPRSATVIAESESILFSLSSGAFYQLYKAMPDQYGILVLNIARDVSRRLRKLEQQLAGGQ
jgi:CRP/FNR family cyclic AMP-dependent transcriptional regulator